MTEQTPAGWTGYSAEDLAWFAENFADTEWAVHVVGPDDVHTRANPDLDEDDPANPVLTEESAQAFAANVREFNAWYHAKYPNEGAPALIPTVMHRGVPVEPKPGPPAPHAHLGVWDPGCASCQGDDAANDDARAAS
jgi:hypothetical protein